MLSGAATSLFTGRGMLYSALRQLLFGAIAAALTFGVGRLIGVSLTWSQSGAGNLRSRRVDG